MEEVVAAIAPWLFHGGVEGRRAIAAMDPSRIPTFFLPAERAPMEQISALHRRLLSEPLLQPLLDSFPEAAVVLNEHRQAVLVNDKLAVLAGKPASELLGLRPGEMLDCVHWREEPGCCGSTMFCSACGAARAILSSQEHIAPDVQECRITCAFNGSVSALDLRVWATPITVGGSRLTVFAIRDITDEKRRAVLERLFFHDILNTAGGLLGLLETWPELPSSEAPETMRMAHELAHALVEEISSARDLAAAERGDLQVAFEKVDAADLLSKLCALYSRSPMAKGKTIATPVVAGPCVIHSSAVLLRRVIGNLIKNALEASSGSATVTVCFHNNGQPVFSVHNQTVMTEDVKRQLFQRSFSTKPGNGRGVGTYSVKLLTEQYLAGAVDFKSPDAQGGTTFNIRLPAASTY